MSSKEHIFCFTSSGTTFYPHVFLDKHGIACVKDIITQKAKITKAPT